MNRIDHDLHWNIFECTDFGFLLLLNCFYDFSFLMFMKSKYFFVIKMFLNFFGRMVFKCLINFSGISFSELEIFL